mmetsp:Transcript_29008/g.26368  ORF Transcript_29008/g.26368 Transcript_29008/m.26368 type:complete len:123 (-) Transcript_29008:28-396(-)
MFCGTILKQENDKNLPVNFNFFHFITSSFDTNEVKANKMFCILHYFKRLALSGISDEKIIIKRLVLGKDYGECTYQGWVKCNRPLAGVEILPTGKIEDAKGAIEIDFANRFLGGGVLRGGMV